MSASITCAFDPQACHHPSLFVAEYKRTNRTKGTKILRCFPHCCPEHVNRSYCGSGLFVSVTNARPDLMVFAHFEESDANFLSVGDEIDVNAVAQSIQTEQTPKGEWIEGFSQSSAYQGTHLFEINPGARWYYEWESAATKAQRFTKHVLRVYVFERMAKHEPSAQATLRVVTLTTSSEFMVVSYRRATAELRADRRILAMLADSAGAGHAVRAIVDVDRKEVLLPLQQQLQLLSTSSPEHQSLMPWNQQSPPYLGADRAPDTHELGKAMWQDLKLWESSHPETLLKSKHLTILCAFLMNVDALQFTHILSHWSTIFADLVDNSPLFPTRQQHHFAAGETNQLIPVGHSRISWYFLTKLAAQQRHQQPQTGHSMHSQAPETEDALSHLVQTCAALVGWLVFDGNNLSLYRELFAEYTNILLDKDALRGSFIKWVNLVYDLIDRFLALSARGDQPLFPSMRVLVEEIISIAFKRDDLQTLRAAVLSVLSATSMMGLQSFVAQVRSNFVRMQVESPRSRTSHGMALTRVLQRFASPFQGSWCFDGTQTVIEQVHANDLRGISVLDLLDWMRECGSVTLQVDDDERFYKMARSISEACC
uniref:Uncharacterized protein n=1 Tax=Globisporangium ultimum (strain ATCC 200006 / CBS 805.95 / DAOM BR144) TaxID=431595 RepID=K3X0C0_GLOUD